MKRLAAHKATLASLAVCAAAALLWVRSYHALDQLYGRALGTGFDVNSYNGRFQFSSYTQYHVRAGVYRSGAVEYSARPFDVLERDAPLEGGSYVARQRWPLRDTGFWEAEPPLCPRAEFRRWLASARQGPGKYVWVRLLVVPYWMVVLATALPLVGIVFRAVRGRRRTRAGLCAACGYDLRASPERCPECGAESRLAALPVAVPAQPPPPGGR